MLYNMNAKLYIPKSALDAISMGGSGKLTPTGTFPPQEQNATETKAKSRIFFISGVFYIQI